MLTGIMTAVTAIIIMLLPATVIMSHYNHYDAHNNINIGHHNHDHAHHDRENQVEGTTYS